MDDVLEAAAEIGIPQSAADLSQGNRLVADYSAAWVREAIRRAGTGQREHTLLAVRGGNSAQVA